MLTLRLTCLSVQAEGLQDEIPHGTIISKLIQSIAPESSMLIGKVVNRFGEVDEIAVF